ncbi:SRPBCC domain-containing protein [Nisaea sp.]|uniref:SRPBCC family protein n=1 Tax=Nisaea sp. TaxID=2024842 RepID=UPI00326385DD
MTFAYLKSPHGADPIIVEGTFPASPERVFRAFTDPEELVQWFGNKALKTAKVDLKVGGSWTFTFAEKDGERDVLQGQYEEIDPGRILVFTWRHHKETATGKGETSPASEVAIYFTEVADGTRVRLSHSMVESESTRLNICGGWDACFSDLDRILRSHDAAAAIA